MCDACAPRGGWSRRAFLHTTFRHTVGAGTLGLGLAGAPALAGARVVAELDAPLVRPRSDWAGDVAPAGAVPAEPEVRFLLVHHTVHGNDYAEHEVVGLLRGVHRFHTGPEKGWPDIAYNFVVDRFGRVWETRAGSLDGAVAGDATGGNQGFDQKCAFLGDHRTEAPSAPARQAMAGLLAWLADRHGVDTAPGATTTFVSRGSNRHAAGAEVVTPTITGHRTMSHTTCPGDAGMALVTDRLPALVTARRSPEPAPSSTASRDTEPAGASTTSVAPTTDPSSVAAPSSDRSPASTPLDTIADEPWAWGAVGVGATVVAGGLLGLRTRGRG